MNKIVFHAYVRLMRKTARAYNYSHVHMVSGNCRRHYYWSNQYLKYARRAVRLAHQLPVANRINFERFLAYDLTRNMMAFNGTLQQAKDLYEQKRPQHHKRKA